MRKEPFFFHGWGVVFVGGGLFAGALPPAPPFDAPGMVVHGKRSSHLPRGYTTSQKFLLALSKQTIDNSDQLKMAGFLWTLAKISQHIWTTYRKRVSVRSLSNDMKRWGLTCQRPTKCAYGQDIAKIERFKKEEYPTIAKRAKAENAVLFWGDETDVSDTENFERGFAKKGHPPVLPVETKRERVNMISAITNQGQTRFMVYEEAMNQPLFLDFLRRLISDADRKIFFIVDNLRVHHGKIVAAWLETHKHKIEVFFLPPYAPQSNPDEYLNHALTLDAHSGDLSQTKKTSSTKSIPS